MSERSHRMRQMGRSNPPAGSKIFKSSMTHSDDDSAVIILATFSCLISH
jgi:hypothetical protein